MILLMHILISLSTIAISGFALISPTRKKIKASYIFTVATFATGTYLVILKPSHLVASCMAGLIFLGIVGILLFLANHKLSKENI